MLYQSVLACALALAAPGHAFLGTAAAFAALAGDSITSTGATNVTGNIGVWPGRSLTGFPPGAEIDGSEHVADGVAQQAQVDARFAFNSLANMLRRQELDGQDLGGMMLRPGVYRFSNSGSVTGQVTLDGRGDPDALFVFQVHRNFVAAPSSLVTLTGKAKACNVYWQVDDSATIGANATFVGNVLSRAVITVSRNANVQGGLYAIRRQITLETDTVVAQSDCE